MTMIEILNLVQSVAVGLKDTFFAFRGDIIIICGCLFLLFCILLNIKYDIEEYRRYGIIDKGDKKFSPTVSIIRIVVPYVKWILLLFAIIWFFDGGSYPNRPLHLRYNCVLFAKVETTSCERYRGFLGTSHMGCNYSRELSSVGGMDFMCIKYDVKLKTN